MTKTITHWSTKGTVCTPNGFAMAARIKRLKKELKGGTKLRRWGM